MDEDSFKQQTPGKNWTEIPYIFLYTTVKFGVSKKKKHSWKFWFAITGIKYTLKYIKIENLK